MSSVADLGVLITKKFNRDKPRTVGYVIAYIENDGMIDKDGRFRVGDEVSIDYMQYLRRFARGRQIP